MPGHFEGSKHQEVPLPPPPSSAVAATPLPLGHLEEPDWSRLLVTLASRSLLPNEMPLAWLLGPEVTRAFCEAGRPPAEPFARGADDSTWVIPRNAAVLDSVRAAGTRDGTCLSDSSAAGLVTLWQEGGSRCLLDLLAARSVAIEGPPIAVGFTLADVVVELASRRWSDLEEIYSSVSVGRSTGSSG